MSSPAGTGTLSDEALVNSRAVNSRAVNSRAAFDAAATFDPANDESFWLCGQGIADPHAVLVCGLPDCLLRHLPTCLPDCLPLIASQIAPLIASVIRPSPPKERCSSRRYMTGRSACSTVTCCMQAARSHFITEIDS
jgi:hypothetical protein